jgi:DNA repair protein RadC
MKSPHSLKYPIGITRRIVVNSVREDVCHYNTDTPELFYQFWQDVIAMQPDYEDDKESVVVVMTNTRLRPYAWHRVSVGTVSESSAHPREVLRPVLLAGAHSFAMLHNHPSGDPSPSRADEGITRRIQEAAKLIEVRFLDHVVVGKPAYGRSPYYSFREAGVVG